MRIAYGGALTWEMIPFSLWSSHSLASIALDTLRYTSRRRGGKSIGGDAGYRPTNIIASVMQLMSTTGNARYEVEEMNCGRGFGL